MLQLLLILATPLALLLVLVSLLSVSASPPLSLSLCVWQFQRIRRLSAQGHDSVTPAYHVPSPPPRPSLCIDFAYKLKFAPASHGLLYVIELSQRSSLGQSLTAFQNGGVAVGTTLSYCIHHMHRQQRNETSNCFDL